MISLRVCGKMDHIESTLRLCYKEPTGHIVNTLLGTLRKKPQWVAQVHAEHILLQIVKETSGYIQNVPSGHLAGHIVKVITMYPLITLWKWSQWVAQVPCWSHCQPHFERNPWVLSQSTHWAPCWVHCKRTQYVSTEYMLNKLLKKSQCNHNGNSG